MNTRQSRTNHSQESEITVARIATRILSLLWPKGEKRLRIRVVGAVLTIIIGKLISVATPFLYKNVVDALSVPMDAAPIALIVAYGVAHLFSQMTEDIRQLLFVAVSQRAVRVTSLEVFRKLHRLSLRFHVERQTGGVATIIARGTTGMEFLLELSLFNIFPILIELVLVSAILLRLYDPIFALITACTILAYLGFTFSVTRWQLQFRRRMNALDVAASMKAIDSLLNYETVKYFGAEAEEARRFDVAKRAYESAAIRNQSTQVAMNAGRSLIIAGGSISIMILAGRHVAQNTMSIGDFVLVNAYLLQLYAPLSGLAMVYTQIKQSLTDVEAMLSMLSKRSEVADAPNAVALKVQAGEITFDNVSFAYDDRRPLLENVSFSVQPGATTAIVGPSGAGKSTIGRLLYRFYDVSAGAIRIDGQDIRSVSQESLRAEIGVVPQETVLFHDTLYYNIAYAKSDATRDEIEAAAAAARLSELVSRLPDGFEAAVGERGLKLSGGEKQRVSIARVILKNPRMLIFDEATSALDTKTEQGILENLRAIARSRTTIVIAHRLSTIVDADEILVLQNGRIVERGDHQQLIRRKGVYAEMWERQQKSTQKQSVKVERA